MAKKLCELCQKNQERDMRFGVRLCQECMDGYDKAMAGDVEIANKFIDPQNFPDATEQAKKNIVAVIARRMKPIEQKEQIKQQEILQQQQAEEKEQKREAYASSVGISYKTRAAKADSLLDGLYANIGKKIKQWAKVIFIVEAIVLIIGALIMFIAAENATWTFLAIGTVVVGPIIAWVSSWILYAFGELVDKTAANEQNTQNILKLMLENSTKDDAE